MNNIRYGNRFSTYRSRNTRLSSNKIQKNSFLYKVIFVIIVLFLFFHGRAIRQVSKVKFEIIKLPFVYTAYSQYDSLLTKSGFIPSDNANMKAIAEVTTSYKDDSTCEVIQRVPTVAVVNAQSKVDNINKNSNNYTFIYYDDGANSFGGNKVDGIEELYSHLDNDKTLVGIIDAVDLKPEYRVVSVDGKYPFLDKEYDMYRDIYLCVYEQDHAYRLSNMVTLINENSPEFWTVSQTGVTAIVRGLARKIDSVGDNKYPARLIKDFLDKSDLVHVSNEISFVEGCDAGAGGVSFCSRPEYFESLEYLGVDIVELTGNHNNDKGSKWSAKSIEMYEEAGMKYFGGGKDLTDASKILYIEDKGTKIAFIGYNFYDWYNGYDTALAGSNKSGANPYSDEKTKDDNSNEKMKKNITEARQNADIVIVDFQFQECWAYSDSESANKACYKPIANPDQKKYFRLAVDYGADIVVGTQAHHPQIIEAYNDGMIFYGLGNLFFDQEEWEGTKQGMILTHVFNEGTYLNTIVTPTYYDASFQVYIPTDSKKTDMLDIYYQR